jgi:PAS domain S-box-containing protein
MSFRKKLQTTLIALIFVVLGLSAVTLWATLQWQKSDSGLREHYQRSLLLQEVRAGTFRAFKELPDAISRRDPNAREEFEALLSEAEKDFRAWTDLAHSEPEQKQVQEVRSAYSGLIQHGKRVFDLVAAGDLPEASQLLEDQIEGVDFQLFENLSTRAAESDTDYRQHIRQDSERIRKVAQVALVTASAATVGLVALLGYYFMSGLFRPLGEVEKALGALGRGDLQRRIPEVGVLDPASARAKDELSMLVQAFNRTVEELGRTTVSKTYLDRIIESMVDALIVASPDGKIRTANPAAGLLFGSTQIELLGKSVVDFIPFSGLTGRDHVRGIETSIRTRDGRDIPISLSRSLMRSDDGDDLGIAIVAQDITDRKRADEQIQAALEEKEILFKEINHRVKNNLQVIDSLLSLQLRQLADPDAREVLQESRNRIQAMALVHEMLYRSETPAKIDFKTYLRQITEHLMSSHGADKRRITLASTIAPVSLGLDTAIPCGLIINELVTNSLKHAFPGGRAGEIAVELRVLPENGYSLGVRDNGVGLPAELRIEENRSLGLRLVRMLTEQIRGSLHVSSDHGARFEIISRLNLRTDHVQSPHPDCRRRSDRPRRSARPARRVRLRGRGRGGGRPRSDQQGAESAAGCCPHGY